MTEKSICFISRYAHYVLLNKTEVKIGGAEIQQAIIARELQKAGWKVQFITQRYNGRSTINVDGIQIFPVLGGIKAKAVVLRFLATPYQLFKTIRRSQARIIYQRNPGPYSFFIALFCKLLGKRFVLAGGSDTNFMPGKELNVNSFLDRLEIKYGVQLADVVILQNQRQRQLLEDNFNKTGPVINNVYEPHITKGISQLPPTMAKRLLWVGRLSYEKRPELFLDLTSNLEDFEFIMVGGTTHKKAFSEEIINRATSIRNLTYMGHIPVHEVEALISQVDGLINTSENEGFPNTFLQAWSLGKPVFSFVDPDDLIAKNGLGAIAESVSDMASKISCYYNDSKSYLAQSQMILTFFNHNFRASARVKEIEKVLLHSNRN